MAVVKNITDGALKLGASGPPIYAGDEVTVADARAVATAWPRSTWEFVEPPAGHTDVGTDAYEFTLPERDAMPGDVLPDLPPGAYADDAESVPTQESAS